MAAFAPILGEQPKILILGSMPGLTSLAAHQYYAHPRNSFWPIMQAIFGVDCEQAYDKRVASIAAKGVCVWDVLHNCTRNGSLDSNIVRATEKPNDFTHFLTAHPSINLVAFNGQVARKIFSRHFKALYDDLTLVEWVDLPSTSPAHASMSLIEKTQIWRNKLQQHQ